jgi:hypothetical protein
MRLIAQIESIGAMPPAILERIRSNGNRQRFERRRLAARQRLACEHASDVGFDRERNDFVGAIFQHTDTNRLGAREILRGD